MHRKVMMADWESKRFNYSVELQDGSGYKWERID